MAFTHQPITEQDVGPAAWKMVGDAAPAPMKLMLAQGVAPLPPRDLLMGLYHLWLLNDPKLSETAGKTVAGLPDPVVEGALADAKLHPGCLDLLGRKLAKNDAITDKIVRHPNTDDETLVGVARVCGEHVCDTLADNQTRWLKCPGIVTSLYNNPNCRMSVIHRMLELADREGVDVKLAAMEEIKAVMKESPAPDETNDAAFKAAMAKPELIAGALDAFAGGASEDELDLPSADSDDDEIGDALDPDEPPPPPPEETDDESSAPLNRTQQLMAMGPMEKIRAALLGDKSDRNYLIRDANKLVAMAVVKSPKVGDNEVINWSSNRALHLDVIRFISNKREWIKFYTVKFNLVMNPKTPMSRALSLLAHLNRNDIMKVARSKNIPSALAKAAKRKMDSRR